MLDSCALELLLCYHYDWVGCFISKAFQTGLGNYLKQYAYKNASTGMHFGSCYTDMYVGVIYVFLSLEDLWEALEKASSKPVAMVMSTWTKQMGYPVLSVESKQVFLLIRSHDPHMTDMITI